MKRAERGRGAGYTILETMIFLAVSAAMFVSAMAFISGRQNRTEFAAAIRDFESTINDVANDVSNGYYSNATNDGKQIICDVNNNIVRIQGLISDSQGANTGCVFIGKALQFRSTTAGDDKYITMSLVGRQYKTGGASYGDSQSYADSTVRPIVNSGVFGDPTPDAYETTSIGGGVTVGCVVYSDTVTPGDRPCTTPAGMKFVDTVAFMTKFQASSFTSTDTANGNASVNLVVPLNAPSQPLVARNVRAAAGELRLYTDAANIKNIVENPGKGVYVCLQSNGTDQHAIITIGGESSRFSTNTRVVGGKC
jgi:type II secretory pathway pseudopilin PulG